MRQHIEARETTVKRYVNGLMTDMSSSMYNFSLTTNKLAWMEYKKLARVGFLRGKRPIHHIRTETEGRCSTREPIYFSFTEILKMMVNMSAAPESELSS